MGARKAIHWSVPEFIAMCAISAFLVCSSSGCLLFATSNDDAGVIADAGPLDGGGVFDGGTFDAGVDDAGTIDDGGSDAGNLEDGGTDAGLDGGDAGFEDAGVDSGNFDDAGFDSGVVDDAGFDGGVVDDDAGPDGGVDCDLLYSEDAFPPQCVGAFAVYRATPAVLSTTTAATLFVHGNFPTDADISLQPVGNGALYTSTRATRSVAAFTIAASTSFQGLARIVDGNASPLGTVLVDLRPHVVTLGEFGNELPQTGAAKKIGQAAVGGVVTNVRPYRVGKYLVCGVGGDGSLEVTCMRTDVDGSVRGPLHGAPGDDPARAFLPQPRLEMATAMVNRRLFVLGGEIDGRPSSLVHSVEIGTDGDTQSARLEPALNTPRRNATAIQVRDLLCIFGGSDDNNISLQSVECARVRAGGLGAFQFAGNLANARSGAAVAVLDDVIVVVGGVAGDNSVARVEFARVDTVPFVFFPGPLVASARSNAASVVLDDKLFVLGGKTEPGVDLGSTTVIQLSFSNGGALQATTGAISMHAALYKFGAVVVGNFVYATPGRTEDGFTTGAAVAHIVPIKAVNATIIRVDDAATDTELAFSSSALVDDSLFIFGGRQLEDRNVSESTIRRIQFGPSGEIATDTNLLPMPEARSHSCAVILDDRVFIIGGSAQTLSTTTTSVMVGTYNEISKQFESFFTVHAGLPVGVNGPRCVVNGDDVYVLGGRPVGGSETFSIQHASVASLLAADNQTTLLFLPVSVSGSPPFIWMASTTARGNNKVVLYGGLNAGGFSSRAILTFTLNGAQATFTTVQEDDVIASANNIPFAFGVMQVGGGVNEPTTSDEGRFFSHGDSNGSVYQSILAIPRRGQVTVLVGPNIQTFGGRNDADPIEPVMVTTLTGGDP